MSFLIRSKILTLPVITLTADDKLSCHNRENLQQPIQTQLSKKAKRFCEFFIAFSESA